MVDIPADEMKKYVDAAIATAKQYVKDNQDTGRLNAADNSPQKNQEIKKFLNRDPHPYDEPMIVRGVGSIFAETLKDAKPAGEGDKNITYLSGAYGSRKLLDDLAKNPKNDAMRELNGLLKDSAHWSFDELKHGMNKHTWVSLKRSGVPDAPEEYGAWRGLMSGMDVTLQAIATDKKLHYTVDDSLTPVNEPNRQRDIADLKRDGGAGKKLRVFAVALTSGQSIAETQKQGTGSSMIEAARSARAFHDFFNDVKANAPDVTLVDKDGDVIYRQKDGKEVALPDAAKAKMAAWEKSFPAKEEAAPAPGLPGSQPTPGGQKASTNRGK